MNKIKLIANEDTNFVFHMLSVAKCGYDNVYGKTYRSLYPAEDLAALKENEELLTVRGGEHCGFLYGALVSGPAAAKVSAKEYYTELMEAAKRNELPEDLKKYEGTIRRVSSVMARHYDSYIDGIWKAEKEKIQAYIPQVLPFFEETDFTEKAEACVGCRLPGESFTASLVTSVENGAEAIDISKEQDVFGITRSPLDEVYFIGHEFIIYLLFRALEEENAFKSFETWAVTEGLAEYYLKKVMGDTRFFNEQQKYVQVFEVLEKEGKTSAVELYRLGLKKG